jgi:GNAT superfamily N-acetyltransferase
MITQWALRPALPEDVEAIADIRAAVMRPDLERLGRFDEHRVRQRFRDSWSPGHTLVVTVAGGLAGSVTVRPAEGGGRLLEHFYLAPRWQGRGLGSAVLRSLLVEADAAGVPVRLTVLNGSPARRLYERHGFAWESEDPIDVVMVRRPRCGELR